MAWTVVYRFPCTEIRMENPQIVLADIDQRSIEDAARRITSTGDVLVRKEIIASLGKAGKRLSVQDTESADVASRHVEREDAEMALVRLVMDNQLIPVNESNKIYARDYVVKTLMEFAPVQEWTVKALASAKRELDSVVRGYVSELMRERKEITSIHSRTLPAREFLPVPLGEQVHDRLGSDEKFVRSRFYGPWRKSLYEAESFDSYSGEYVVATLLETSPHIVWWHRLHMQDKATIMYTAKDTYNPDFVAHDDEGRYWIIEGKDDGGRTNETVQAKRTAAEKVVRRLMGHEDFIGQKWGYLIAYEGDAKSSDSWDDLKAKAQPVVN